MLWLPRLGGLRPKDEDRQEVRLPWPTREEHRLSRTETTSFLTETACRTHRPGTEPGPPSTAPGGPASATGLGALVLGRP